MLSAKPIGAAMLAGLLLALAVPGSAAAQSTGFVTGIPGRDPAGDDEIGWGPAYRPETSFSQPGTPPTPGDYAGAAYRARTGRGPYDAVQSGREPDVYAPQAGSRRVAQRRIKRSHAVRARRTHQVQALR